MRKSNSVASNPPKKSAIVDSSPVVKDKSNGSVSAVEVKKRSVPTPIESVGQLLSAFYTGKFKRATLNAKERKKIRGAAKLDEGERVDLLNVAASDRTLSRTRELMLFSISLDEPTITDQVGEFCHLVIGHHPAFKNSRLILAELTEIHAVEKLMNNDYSALQWSKSIKPLTKREQEKCKVNAIHCLLLWFRIERELPIDRIQHILQISLWESVSKKYNRERDKLPALLGTKDSFAVSIACAMLKERIDKASRAAEVARQKEEKAVAYSQQLRENLAQVQAKMEESETRASCLEKDLAQEKQLRIDENTHLKYDYEQLRGRILRCLKEELSLLDDGLRALQRASPKVHVMIDHAERVIDGLKREIERLRGR